MTVKNRPPVGPYVWLTRDLLGSDAWRSLGINARRFIDFLMLEHMGKAGQANGKLKAPHRQLEAFGIDARYITSAICQAEERGLVDCRRGGMRVATLYTLTWQENHDGAPPTNRWQAYRNPDLPPLPAAKSRNLPDKGKAGLPDKGKADGPNLPDKGRADDPKNLPDKGKALLRKFLPGRQPYSQKEKSAQGPGTGSTAPPMWRPAEPVSAAAEEEAVLWIGAPPTPDRAQTGTHTPTARRRVACHTGAAQHDKDYFDA